MADRFPTAAELRRLLVHLLEGATEKPASHWERLVGPIERRPLTANPRTNRAVTLKPGRQSKPVEHAVRVVRGEHPYVDW